MARAGERSEWVALAVIVGVVMASPLGCKKDDTGSESTVDVSGPITDFWPLVLEPALSDAIESAEDLRVACREWSDAADIMGAATEISHGDAQEAFVTAMLLVVEQKPCHVNSRSSG